LNVRPWKKNILNFNMYLFDIDANVTMLDQWANTDQCVRSVFLCMFRISYRGRLPKPNQQVKHRVDGICQRMRRFAMGTNNCIRLILSNLKVKYGPFKFK